MVQKRARTLAIWTALSLAPALAVAQTPGPAPQPAQPPGPPGPTAVTPGAASSAAPAGSLGGYAWGPTKPVTHRTVARRAGPEATLPGFESLADGTTRLFVQL